jgi:ABC-type multidrug transport system ATPase subunit
MAKRDRVFAVERAIWALGLESIRDARVGTVERRGISGGQRKRVNVGLEMVAEPSLLILDGRGIRRFSALVRVLGISR